MIVKNEQDVLDRCLSCVKSVFDEIIIVDTGSTDKTKEIAFKYTDLVYDFKWCNDFSKARNFSLLKATKDFIMWLDADDVIDNKNLKKLKQLKTKLTSNVDIVMLKYAVGFNEFNKPNFTFYRERILNRTKKFMFEDPVHEAVIPSGNIQYENIIIEHRKIKENPPKRNLLIYESLISQGLILTPRQQFYYSRELYFNNKINKAVKNFNKFLLMPNAFVENKIEACLTLSKCYQFKKDHDKALDVLFKSFSFSSPRAEICTEIGCILADQAKYRDAIFWLKMATKIKPNYNSGSFIQIDLYRFVPFLELCVCYYYIGDYKSSYLYNEKAKKINPNHASVLHNEKVIKERLMD